MSLDFSLRRALAAGALALSFGQVAKAAPPADSEANVIDRHVCVAVDVSASVDASEYETMMRGIYEGLMSRNTQQMLATSRYMISSVFFASGAVQGDTAIIDSSQEGHKFLASAFYDPETAMPRARPTEAVIGRFTGINMGLEACEQKFLAEGAQGIQPLSRTTIVLGDGLNNVDAFAKPVEAIVERLAVRFASPVHGVPVHQQAPQTYSNWDYVAPQDLDVHYSSVVVTPEKLECLCMGAVVPVMPGRVHPARGFQHIAPAIEHAMRYVMN